MALLQNLLLIGTGTALVQAPTNLSLLTLRLPPMVTLLGPMEPESTLRITQDGTGLETSPSLGRVVHLQWSIPLALTVSCSLQMERSSRRRITHHGIGIGIDQHQALRLHIQWNMLLDQMETYGSQMGRKSTKRITLVGIGAEIDQFQALLARTLWNTRWAPTERQLDQMAESSRPKITLVGTGVGMCQTLIMNIPNHMTPKISQIAKSCHPSHQNQERQMTYHHGIGIGTVGCRDLISLSL